MTGSVTRWLFALRNGNSEAARQLWERYFIKVLRLARRKLGGRARAIAFDEEDVAAGVLGDLLVKLQRGGFCDLSNRNELWHLLVAITYRKAAVAARRENALKRGGGQLRLESELAAFGRAGLDDLAGRDLAVEVQDVMSGQCRMLIESLKDQNLEKIALWKLAGHSNEEIAAKQGCTRVTIQRKLQLIRKIWDAEAKVLVSSRMPLRSA